MRVNGYSIVSKMLDRALPRTEFRARRATRFLISSAMALIAAGAFTIGAVTISGCKTTPIPAVAGASESSQDAKLTDFLRKHFRIPDTDSLKLGPPTPGPMPGLYTRTVTASGQGGSATSTIFVNEAGDKLIFGQFLDLNQDPWGRVDVKELHLDDRPTLGPADAPVTLVEFADFECPHCARALPKVEAAVNRHPGQVRLIYKYFPLAGHTWARAAAIASECARMQNPEAFWDFASTFYRDQSSIDANNIAEKIDTLTTENKLDGNLMHACMMGKAADERVDQDLKDGDAVHVNSTPTLFVNGIPLSGEIDDKIIDYVVSSELENSRHAAR
ncbi:MAG TPA: DsbA family protein [Candidatus Binataceae bacterium]|nr:DsbA family protein [Candidatus Binataceae bacterium]